MKRHPQRRQGGVTLVELLMALLICGLVLAPLAGMLDSSILAGTRQAGRVALEQDLDFALERIAGAVRATPRKVLSPQDSQLADSGNWFDKSRFRLAADGRLIEARDGVDNVLAESVAAFSVSARSVGSDVTMVEARLRLESAGEAVQGSLALRMGGPRP